MNLVGKYIGKKVGKSMSLTDKIIELCSYDDEQEWFEFKENWFQPEELGEYVSALTHMARMLLPLEKIQLWLRFRLTGLMKLVKRLVKKLVIPMWIDPY